MDQELLMRQIVEQVMAAMSGAAPAASAPVAKGSVSAAQYPLAEHMPEKIKTPTGKAFGDLSYEKVISGGEGSFVELSILNFAGLSYELERWSDAYGAYASLYEVTKFDSNKYISVCNMMRAAFRNLEWEKAAADAEKVLAHEMADESVKTEAMYVKARSFIVANRRDEAFALLETLAKDLSGAYGAEAAYRIIQDCYDRGDFQQVEDKVYAFADAGSGQTYWLAKSFIVLGDSFMERDDVQQAQATFESVRDGYTPVSEDDDVLDNVRMRLDRIAQLAVNQE
jgi:TolA-binding protein